MDEIKCKLCGAKHSLREPHQWGDAKPVKVLKATRAPAVVDTAAKHRHCPSCTCEGRKVYEGAADRQRAYRGRKGGGINA